MTTILYVEDRPSILNIVAEKLELAGYDVLTATNIEDAVRLFKSDRPDIMVLDYRLMDNVTGIKSDTIQFLKKLGDARANIPALMLSATPLHVIKAENPDFDKFNLEFMTKKNKFEVDSMVIVDKIRDMLRATRPIINSAGGSKSL
ncbi:MAG: response regulator [Pseudomonadota bacterium]|nr:response regulator [Pseudomonadota bacterium]